MVTKLRTGALPVLNFALDIAEKITSEQLRNVMKRMAGLNCGNGSFCARDIGFVPYPA